MSRTAGLLVLAVLAAGCAAPVRTGPRPTFPGGPIGAARTTDATSAALVPDTLAGRFAVYTADGAPADLGAVVAAMAAADVVFLGEEHDDPVTHALQLRLLEHAHRRFGAGRPVALGLEMVERDARLVLDEYLAGTIRERDFLAASRPWGNFADYRPLVEYAKAHGLPVLATNAPGRYVNLVARQGPGALGGLDRQARAFLPRLPVAPPSAALAAKFRAQMEAMAGPHTAPSPHGGAHGGAAPSVENLLAAQNLRDAAMAEAVARWLDAHRGGLVLHLNGRFHSEGGLGIPEHLARYRRGAHALVVTFLPVADPSAAPAARPGDGFVILTQQPASGE